MNTFIGLFRVLSVGGGNSLPMRDVVAVLESLGCEDLRTYIQSGNAVAQHPQRDALRLAAAIRTAIISNHGFKAEVLLLNTDELERAMRSNPFPDAESDPSKLHLFFVMGFPGDPRLDVLEAARTAGERFALEGDEFYLHAPNGIGRSRLVARLEKAVGVPITGRNWSTVCKIMEMATHCD